MRTKRLDQGDRVAAQHWRERLNRQVYLVADRLPNMIDNAATAYERLAAREMADDAKSVAAQLAALRSALAHLDALINLARRLDEPGVGGPMEDDDLLEQLCSQAAAAVALLPEEPED